MGRGKQAYLLGEHELSNGVEAVKMSWDTDEDLHLRVLGVEKVGDVGTFVDGTEHWKAHEKGELTHVEDDDVAHDTVGVMASLEVYPKGHLGEEGV